MMLIRSSLPSSNPVTLPDTVHLLFEAEAKIEKITKIRKNHSKSSKKHICSKLMGRGVASPGVENVMASPESVFKLWIGLPTPYKQK